MRLSLLLIGLAIASVGCVPRARPTTSKEQEATPEPTIRATAFTISHEWGTNELTAKRDYLHQQVRIVGRVENVKADGHVTLTGDGFFGAVGCSFSHKTGLADLSQNEWVVIEGHGTAKNKFDKCRLIKARFHSQEQAWDASK